MKIYDLKEYIYDLVSRYFTAASVVWANEISTKPTLPLVTLRLGNLTRHPFPEESEDESGPVRYYPANIILEVNIFSCGGAMEGGYSDDTAADMNEFLLYLESPDITDELFGNGLDMQPGTVQPIPALLGESKFEFRTMVEIDISFTQRTAGACGVKRSPEELAYKGDGFWAAAEAPTEEDWKPTSAGGGTYEIAVEQIEYIETAEIEEKKEG